MPLGGEVEPDDGAELAGAAQAGPLGAAASVGEFGDDAQAPAAEFEIVDPLGDGRGAVQQVADEGGSGSGVDDLGADGQAWSCRRRSS